MESRCTRASETTAERRLNLRSTDFPMLTSCPSPGLPRYHNHMVANEPYQSLEWIEFPGHGTSVVIGTLVNVVLYRS